MGVMPCSRKGCDNILVDNDFTNTGDRICDSCIEELETFLTCSTADLTDGYEVEGEIQMFMDRVSLPITVPERREQVKAMLAQIIHRRKR